MALDLTGELLTIRYVTLEQALAWRWGENPKRHDLDALAQSITQYGFRDPSLYDSSLPGIPAGNGRLEALEQLHAAGDNPPRGVGLDESGCWYVPIVFGVDAESQAMAQAFGIAHNNLTVVGFTAAEVARLWRQEDYLALLERLAEQDTLPVTVEADTVDYLAALATVPVSAGQLSYDPPGREGMPESLYRNFNIAVTPEQKSIIDAWLQHVVGVRPQAVSEEKGAALVTYIQETWDGWENALV